MDGVKLFVHAVRLVFTDLSNVLRLSGALYLGVSIFTILVALTIQVPPNTPLWFIINLVIALLYLVAFSVIAVAWHRYILLNEPVDGYIPRFERQPLIAYIRYSLLLAVILIGIAIAIAIVAGLLSNLIGQLAIVILIIGYIFMLIASYRLSPLLPASAIGRPMRVAEAWQSTAGATWSIVVLAILSLIGAYVIDLPAAALAVYGGQAGGFLAMLWTLATGWVKFAVGISIVTTLYGVYVENRSI
ncbi:MAG: hypothetical protein ACO1OG_04580 [Devosia sp.]